MTTTLSTSSAAVAFSTIWTRVYCMKNVSVTVKLQGKQWEISGNYIPRNDEQDQPSSFEIKQIAQVDGGDVATLLIQYEDDEIAQVALREYEEEQAYQIKEQAA